MIWKVTNGTGLVSMVDPHTYKGIPSNLGPRNTGKITFSGPVCFCYKTVQNCNQSATMNVIPEVGVGGPLILGLHQSWTDSWQGEPPPVVMTGAGTVLNLPLSSRPCAASTQGTASHHGHPTPIWNAPPPERTGILI